MSAEMSGKAVCYDKKDSIGLITLNQPCSTETINTQAVYDELAGIRDEICYDPDIRVVLITGEGVGALSIAAALDDHYATEVTEDAIKRHSICDIIGRFEQLVIIGLDGDAVGQGLEMALACDIRIASETSHFGLPQIKAGHIPWDGGTQRLSRLVGKGKALEMILTGEVIDAQEALRMGLVHRIVSATELREAAMKTAREMASKSPVALRYAKEAVYKGMDMTLEQGLRLEADLYLLIHTTKDRTEGIQAFLEKRKPQFEGR